MDKMVDLLGSDPLGKIALADLSIAYHHMGYWQCMDTIRDKQALEDLWATGKAQSRGLNL